MLHQSPGCWTTASVDQYSKTYLFFFPWFELWPLLYEPTVSAPEQAIFILLYCLFFLLSLFFFYFLLFFFLFRQFHSVSFTDPFLYQVSFSFFLFFSIFFPMLFSFLFFFLSFFILHMLQLFFIYFTPIPFYNKNVDFFFFHPPLDFSYLFFPVFKSHSFLLF